MVTTLDHGTRNARKTYRCGMCAMVIRPGDTYAFQTNIYDDRVYTWHECIWCDRDLIVNYVNDWTGGYNDEGVEYEQASEWAQEAVGWPKHWLRYDRAIHPAERLAARNWLARSTDGEGE